jgi:peptidoglycan/LPS O-acetylase OafA/YrhL
MRQRQPGTQTAQPSPSGDGHRVWFAQALRAVACLIVVLAHLGLLFPVAPQILAERGLFPPPGKVTYPGYIRFWFFLCAHKISIADVGVALFFLTSGFVIPISLRRYTPRGFLLRRFFRLYPTLWVTQLLMLAVVWGQAHHYGVRFPHAWTTIALNTVMLSSYFGRPVIEGVYWTLYCEEVFYLICTVCAWRGLLVKPRVVLVILALAGLPIVFQAVAPAGPPALWRTALACLATNLSFSVYIFIGVVLHHLYFGVWRPRLGAPLVVGVFGLYAVCAFTGPLHDTWAHPTVTLAGLIALTVFATLLCVNRWLPYSRFLDLLADVSYPLYLIHFTIGGIVINAVYVRTGSFPLGLGVALTTVVALAALVNRFVERPSMRFGRRLAERLLAHRAGASKPTASSSAAHVPLDARAA